MGKVMVASTDPVIASLLGTLLEVDQQRVVFPATGEAIHTALDREQPELLLLDCDHPELRIDGGERVTGHWSAGRAAVALFSPGRVDDEVRARAERSRLSWFTLPIDRATLEQVLAAALAGRPRPGPTKSRS